MTEMGLNPQTCRPLCQAVFQTLSFSDPSGLNMWGDKAAGTGCAVKSESRGRIVAFTGQCEH